MKARYIIYSSIIYCLISLGACSPGGPVGPDLPEDTVPYGLQVGDTAADFTAKDQNNQDVSLYDYSGKVILFEFSADWCGPCREEAPYLEVIYNEYKDRGLQVITLLTSGSTAEWAQTYNITFPVLDDSSLSVYHQYEEVGHPINIVVDRNFVIRYKVGGFKEDTIRTAIEMCL
jgi:peroxiredoxin